MGSTPSVTLDGPLQALTDPLIAINPMYCGPKEKSLHLHKTGFGSASDLTIRDIATNQIYFHIHHQNMSLSRRKTLLNHEKVEIAYMRLKFYSSFTYHIYEDLESTILMCTIRVHGSYSRRVVDIEFPTDQIRAYSRYQLEIEGNWDKRGVIFWGKTENGNKRQAVSCIRESISTSSYTASRHDYILDIAPNMDMALMLFVCMALEEANSD
jgi:hypothetical protein